MEKRNKKEKPMINIENNTLIMKQLNILSAFDMESPIRKKCLYKKSHSPKNRTFSIIHYPFCIFCQVYKMLYISVLYKTENNRHFFCPKNRTKIPIFRTIFAINRCCFCSHNFLKSCLSAVY